MGKIFLYSKEIIATIIIPSLMHKKYWFEREGESYATALRKAKLELIGDEMMEPMDWAGFALVGG